MRTAGYTGSQRFVPTSSFNPIRSFQWDLARQVERLDWLLKQLPRYADWGYQELHLHLEDAVEYPSLPGVARKDAYSYSEFTKLVRAADRVGIKVVPIVNLLGHTQYLIKVPELRDLNELRAEDGSPLEQGQICPLHPRTLEIAEKLLRDMAPFCTAGKVHVGLDESFHLGKHPRSQREIARIGRAAHFARYVGRLDRLARSLGLEMSMWADMLYFLPEAIPLLPRGITTYEWYYHAFRRLPKVELFNFKEVDIATPLRERGIALYGCPMNGAFRFEPLPHFTDRMDNILAWWRHSRRIGAKGFLVSSWEPYRLAIELTTAVDAAAACLWLEPEIDDPSEMLARGFERAFGKRGRAAARLALAADKYPFGGYPRWQINERWDTASRLEPLTNYRKEERHFHNLAQKARADGTPVPLRASLAFRHYLAQRDVFVRRVARLGARATATRAQRSALAKAFRPALRAGLRAAQTMWRLTRDARVSGPNDAIVRHDAERLAAWVAGKSNVFGPVWQLCYDVWNFAPAAQCVVVEQRAADGSWRTLQSCYTIEFQSRAANARSDIVRSHAAPIAWDGKAESFPELRIAVRGTGEVKVGRVFLVNERSGPAWRFGGKGWRRIGKPAWTGEPWPQQGYAPVTIGVLELGTPKKLKQ